MKRALITGITGQDGSYLAELLLSKGYEVHGLIRRSSSFNTSRIDHIYVDPHESNAKLLLHHGDLTNSEQLVNLIYNLHPDEIYNLGAQSHVRVSFDMPGFTGDVTGLGTTRILEAIRRSGIKTRFYQASSSEMFGSAPAPQNESTSFAPVSPYAVAKVYAYWMTVTYRQAYGIHCINGILFNHESPRRGETFVTRKVTRAVANILAGKQDSLYLGNLNSKRDWGYAPEYVEAMWMMMQIDEPQDFVIGTGENNSVKDFVKTAFEYAGLEYKKFVKVDERYLRPIEVEELKADPSKVERILGWRPKIYLDELISIMVDADMESIGIDSIGKGKKIIESNFLDWHKWNGSGQALSKPD